MIALPPTPTEVFGPLTFVAGLVIGALLGFTMAWLMSRLEEKRK